MGGPLRNSLTLLGHINPLKKWALTLACLEHLIICRVEPDQW